MNLLYTLFWIIISVILQTLLFNQLQLLGGVAMVYMIALIKMPVEVNRNLQILAGFLCGLIIDIFSNTLGMHTLTVVTAMWLRMPILHLFVNVDDIKAGVPGNTLMGMSTYIRYALTMLVVHAVLLYFIESFTLFNVLVTLLKAFMSVVLTFIAVIALEFTTLEK